MKKKVLFFIHSSTGGAERVSITLGKILPKDQYDVKFVLVDRTKGSIEKFIPDGYEFEYMLCPNIWLGVITRMIKLLRKERPYAVFATSMALATRVLFTAHLVGGIKTVIRNCNYFSTIRWDQLLLCRWTYKYADKIIAQQEEMRDDILKHISGIIPQKVIVLQNPLDIDTIENKSNVPSPYPDDDILKYVWVGRFSKIKGQDVLARAFVKVARQNIKAHLYFIGKEENDEFSQSVHKIVEDACISDRVHFVGFDTNPYRWMKYCDCFVLPSRIEGLPNALIEAQYLHRPAVATTCIPIISRIIKDGVTGYTVPSEDYNAMAEAMLKAPSLGSITMVYKSAPKEDFIRLF